jgi:hypothetical protein
VRTNNRGLGEFQLASVRWAARPPRQAGISSHRKARQTCSIATWFDCCTRSAGAPTIASPLDSYFAERSEALSLTYSKAQTDLRQPMKTLPVERALRIYGTLANRSETKGARERLSKFLMKKYIEGEKDEHRLTVEGLSYLRALDREIDSRS